MTMIHSLFERVYWQIQYAEMILTPPIQHGHSKDYHVVDTSLQHCCFQGIGPHSMLHCGVSEQYFYYGICSYHKGCILQIFDKHIRSAKTFCPARHL